MDAFQLFESSQPLVRNSRMRYGAARKVYGKRKIDTPTPVLYDEDISRRTVRPQETAEALHSQMASLTITDRAEHKERRNTPVHMIPQQIPSKSSALLQTTYMPKQAMPEQTVAPKPRKLRHRCSSGPTNDGTDSTDKTDSERIIPKPKPRPRRSSGRIEDIGATAHVRPILDESISPMASKGIQCFDSWARRAGDLFDIEKLAEGSYGEVYQLKLRSQAETKDGDPARETNPAYMAWTRHLSRLRAYKDVIFKIIPLRPARGTGSRKFTSVAEIVSEVRLMKLLDPVPGFARFREVHVVQGRFPEAYQRAWTAYSMTKPDDCFNPDPGKKRSYPDSQLWAILEMDNAGFELEKYTWSDAFQMYDIFWGVAMGLARAEQFASFEHRDLHLGNICIKPRKRRNKYKLLWPVYDNRPTGFGFGGFETSIIDYSLSRANLMPQLNQTETTAQGPASESEAAVAWCDLDKRQIFDAVGRDEDEKLLRDTYRLMRAHVYDEDGGSSSPWKNYHPGTNLVWLQFLAQMLLAKCPSEVVAATTPHKTKPLSERCTNIQSLCPGKSRKAKNKSSGNIVDSSQTTHLSSREQDALVEWQAELLARLEAVITMLTGKYHDVDGWRSSSAGDLVAFAITAGWLKEEDFLS